MSAIWGCIDLSGGELPGDIAERMEKPLRGCKIDRFSQLCEKNAAMGCGVQYITPEAQLERLPITDGNRDFLFTADVILDNREELIKRLGWEVRRDTIPDGDILCEMFARFGEKCLNDLLGAYAFVYYDRRAKTVSLVSDAVGNRCLYYIIKGNILYFSTLIESIVGASGHDGVNGRWLSDFLALDNLGVAIECEETIYAGIDKLAPRQIVKWSAAGLDKRLYWQPDTSLLLLGSDEEYAARLREIWRESVRCLLRADEVALMLSGGLDSTAVACQAAPILRDRGKALHTYTWVPRAGYESDKSPYYVTDERDDVLKTKEFLEAKGCRLECGFIDLEGVDVWGAHTAEMTAMEMPYKSLQNMLWSAEGLRRAYDTGCRLMLDGGFGNVTISLNNIDNLLHELLRERKYITYLRQMRKFGDAYGMRKKDKLRRAIKIIRDFYRPQKADTDDAALFGKSLTNRRDFKKYQTRIRFSEFYRGISEERTDYDKYRTIFVHDRQFSMKGEMVTKHSLLTGVVTRDPTMDKRIIGFCSRIPADQYARDGVSRRLVREYLAPEMPGHVMSIYRRGLQSADFLGRMAQDWDRIKSEWEGIFKSNMDSSHVDCQRALTELEMVDPDMKNVRDFDIYRLGYTAMALEFARRLSD